MRGSTAFFLSSLWTLFFAACRFQHVAAFTASPFFPQAFLFDWNPPGTGLPIPLTQQCETLHITWERGSTGVGPNPVSPYYLEIFTSIYTVPIVIPAGNGPTFDYQVPFSPGTQYQICMWDSQGVSGGCQNIYTMVPNTTVNATTQPTCPNVTLPATPLQVDAQVVNGVSAQYGWIPQCTDIEVHAKNGTGPYTLTVAPTLHPPLNITSNDGPINWTVAFTHGFPFFISVTDAHGNSWSQGPLHSGDNSDSTCLDTNNLLASSQGQKSKSSSVPAAIGAGVGGIVVGLLAGAFGILAVRRYRSSRPKVYREDLMRDSQHSPRMSQPMHGVPATGGTTAGGMEYLVEPFAIPNAGPASPPVGSNAPLLEGGPTSPITGSRSDIMSTSGLSEPAAAARNVYVVHHDGGRAPVTVYADEGAEVVELPPRYLAGSASAPSEARSTTSRETDINRRREPGATRKPRI